MLAAALGCAPAEAPRSADTGAADPGASLAGCAVEAGPAVDVAVGDEVSLEATLTSGEASAWLWDLGDGTVVEGSATVEHRYSAGGVFTAVVQCAAPDGSRSTDSVSVTAYAPPAETPPRWSSTIALSDDGAQLFVVNPEADTLAVVDPTTGSVEEWPACDDPSAVATDGTWVAVACRGEGALVVWDRTTERQTWVDLGQGPDSSPQGIAGREGHWVVSLPRLGVLARVEPDGRVVANAVGPDPFGVALLPEGDVVATRWRSADTGAALYRLPGDFTEETPATLLSLPLDREGDSDTTTGGVPNLLEQVVPSPSGSALYLPFSHANLLRGSWVSGETLDHDKTVRAVLATVDPRTGAETTRRKQFDERGRANAVVPSPLGERLYIVHTGTRSITALDTATGDLAGSILDVGHAPTGAALAPDGETLFVHAWLDRAVRAYDVSDLSRVREPLWTASTVSEEPLPASLLRGKQLFWDSADQRLTAAGYLSCANCHPHGDHDGRTWDFTDRGEGLRNTTSLLGRGGTDQGPLHWTGNFDEIQDFENDLRGPNGGTGLLSDSDWDATADPLGLPKAGRSADLDALAAYVSSLSQAPASPFAEPEGGAAAFSAAGCGACHPAPHYTDSSLDAFVRHDVGTLTDASGARLGVGPLTGLDTPSLLGAWSSAPYLHDGSAPTVEDAILAHEGLADDLDVSLIADFVRAL